MPAEYEMREAQLEKDMAIAKFFGTLERQLIRVVDLLERAAELRKEAEQWYGETPVSEQPTSDGGIFRLLWSCGGCKDDMYYSNERCCQCGKPRPEDTNK